MSEQTYLVISDTGRVVELQFDEADDCGCLCTFPNNDEVFGRLLPGRVFSLALLGAAVVLAARGAIKEDRAWLPHCVPAWVRREIRRAVRDLLELRA